MWRNVVPCDQPAGQGNHFELIPTVTMESRHSVYGQTSRDFSSIYRYGVMGAWNRKSFNIFPEKLPFETTHYGEIFKILFWKDSPPRAFASSVQISWNLADRKSVKSRVVYLTKNRLALSLSLLRRLRPKSARASGKQCRFTSGGVMDAWTPFKRAIKCFQYSTKLQLLRRVIDWF